MILREVRSTLYVWPMGGHDSGDRDDVQGCVSDMQLFKRVDKSLPVGD